MHNEQRTNLSTQLEQSRMVYFSPNTFALHDDGKMRLSLYCVLLNKFSHASEMAVKFIWKKHFSGFRMSSSLLTLSGSSIRHSPQVDDSPWALRPSAGRARKKLWCLRYKGWIMPYEPAAPQSYLEAGYLLSSCHNIFSALLALWNLGPSDGMQIFLGRLTPPKLSCSTSYSLTCISSSIMTLLILRSV